jgi:hypothetical protein
MAEPIKVVARYINGRMIKGITHDFFPNKDRFHIVPADNPLDKPIEVTLKHLKAVFVVRSFDGDSGYVERKKYQEGDTPYGTPLEVTFTDGEVMVGSSMGFDPRREGFFLSPVDPEGNNLRVFVITSTLKTIRQLLLKSGMSIEVPLPRAKPNPSRVT